MDVEPPHIKKTIHNSIFGDTNTTALPIGRLPAIPLTMFKTPPESLTGNTQQIGMKFCNWSNCSLQKVLNVVFVHLMDATIHCIVYVSFNGSKLMILMQSVLMRVLVIIVHVTILK